MQISAYVRNAGQAHDVSVSTAGASSELVVPAKAGGRGSSVNGETDAAAEVHNRLRAGVSVELVSWESKDKVAR